MDGVRKMETVVKTRTVKIAGREGRIEVLIGGKKFRFYITKDFVLVHNRTTINDVTFSDSLNAKVGSLNDDGSIYQVDLTVRV
jgi:hypothetical protein